MVSALFIAVRPHQWIKNLIIFAPLLFSQTMFDLPMFLKTLAGFSLFCLLCGGVYLINDLLDFEEEPPHSLWSALTPDRYRRSYQYFYYDLNPCFLVKCLIRPYCLSLYGFEPGILPFLEAYR